MYGLKPVPFKTELLELIESWPGPAAKAACRDKRCTVAQAKRQVFLSRWSAELFDSEWFGWRFTVWWLFFARIFYFGNDWMHPEGRCFLPHCGPKNGGVG
jgi:hypothetical protein